MIAAVTGVSGAVLLFTALMMAVPDDPGSARYDRIAWTLFVAGSLGLIAAGWLWVYGLGA